MKFKNLVHNWEFLRGEYQFPKTLITTVSFQSPLTIS